MEKNLKIDEVQRISPLLLANIGDAYFHLFVRTKLLKFTRNITRLHNLSAQIVSTSMQTKIYYVIEKILSDEEKEILLRGRNAENRKSRNKKFTDYNSSTGLEALIGELFLQNNVERLEEICQMSFEFAFGEIIQNE